MRSDDDGEDPFLTRVHRALTHDLRSPLGTISNYAAILEFQAQASPDEIRTFAKRIRSTAQRTAESLSELSEALVLSSRAPAIDDIDVSSLLRGILAGLTLHARFPARGSEPNRMARADTDMLTFAWRSFLTAAIQADNARSIDIDVEVGDPDRASVEMWIGPRESLAHEPFDAQRFASLAPGTGKSSYGCFALGLAENLVKRRGGVLELWGRPGDAARLRIRENDGR